MGWWRWAGWLGDEIWSLFFFLLSTKYLDHLHFSSHFIVPLGKAVKFSQINPDLKLGKYFKNNRYGDFFLWCDWFWWSQGMVLEAAQIGFYSTRKGKWTHCYCIISFFVLPRRLASFWEGLWQTNLPPVIFLLREDLACHLQVQDHS